MLNITRVAVLATLLASAVVQLPSLPLITRPLISASNGAKAGLLYAPGSFVALETIGPEFPEDLSIILIELKVGDQVFPLLPVEPPDKSRRQVWVAIPSNVPLGDGFITVRAFSGIFYVPAFPIEVVAPGIFTRNLLGYGLASALDANWAPIRLTNAAQPGHEISLYVTGLGGLTAPDVTVEIAGEQGTVLFAGPQGYPGLDQINLIVPENAYAGCYVPVVVKVHGVASNMATLPISADPTFCRHPLGLTAGELSILDQGGSVGLMHVAPASRNWPLGGWGWNEGAQVSFPRVNANEIYVASGPQLPDAQLFSCPARVDDAALTIPTDDLDAGSAMTLVGPRSKQITLPRPYAASTPPLEAPYFSPGLWRLSVPGGTDIPSLTQSFVLPPVLSSLNIKFEDVLPSDRDLQLTWDPAGFTASDTVTIQLDQGATRIVNGVTTNLPKVVCRTRAWTGRFVLPKAYVEQWVNKGTVWVRMSVGPHPEQRTLFRASRRDGTTIPAYVDYAFLQVIQVFFK